MGLVLIAGFALLQGLVIFATAFALLKISKTSHWFAKIAAMIGSYLGWVVFTITGYTLLGGEGGLMDGFGMVLFLCFTAFVSSSIFGMIWLASPLFNRTSVDG